MRLFARFRQPEPRLSFAISCPDCGGGVRMLANGKPSPTRTTAMVCCTVCESQAQVLVQLDVTHRPKYTPPTRRSLASL